MAVCGQALGRHDDEQRGFMSPTAAANYRHRQTEKVERREVIHTRETFGSWTAASASCRCLSRSHSNGWKPNTSTS
jgi:hypothetical protein